MAQILKNDVIARIESSHIVKGIFNPRSVKLTHSLELYQRQRYTNYYNILDHESVSTGLHRSDIWGEALLPSQVR